MTELEDIKGMRKILADRAREAGSNEKLAEKLSTKKVKFSGSLIGMVITGSRNVSTKLANALGYRKVTNYERIK